MTDKEKRGGGRKPAPSSFEEMPTAHLKCRGIGHAWDITLVTVVRVERRRVYRALMECLRCGSTREDLVPRGDGPFFLRRSYGYADGYMVEALDAWGGRGLLKRNSRDVLLRRLEER